MWSTTPLTHGGQIAAELVRTFTEKRADPITNVDVVTDENGRALLVSRQQRYATTARDLETGEHLYTVHARYGGILIGKEPPALTSPDGRRLAMGGEDDTIDIWRLATGEHETRVPAPYSTVSWTPDSRFLAVQTRRGQLRLWDPEDRRWSATFTGAQAGWAFLPGERIVLPGIAVGLRVVSLSADDRTARRFRLPGRRGAAKLAGIPEIQLDGSASDGRVVSVHCVVSPNTARDWLAVVRAWERVNEFGGVAARYTISFHDSTTGRLRDTVFQAGSCLAATAGPDGSWLAVATTDSLDVWSTGDHPRSASVPFGLGHSLSSWHAGPGPDERPLLVAGDRSGDVVLVDGGRRAAPRAFGRSSRPHAHRCFPGPRGEWLTVSYRDRSTEILDVRTGTILRGFEGQIHGHFVNDAGTTGFLEPGGRWVATVDDDDEVGVWDVVTGVSISRLRRAGPVLGTAGAWLATSPGGGAIKVWHPLTGKLLSTLTIAEPDRPLDAVVDPRGTWLAVGGSANTVQVWDPVGGQRLHVLENTHERDRFMGTDEEGRYLYTATPNDDVDIWDTASFRRHATLYGHRHAVTAGAGAGDVLITADISGELRCWNPSDGALRSVDAGYGGEVNTCRLSRCGRWVATTDYSGVARIWRTDPLRHLAGIAVTQPLFDCCWVTENLICVVGNGGTYLFRWAPPGLG